MRAPGSSSLIAAALAGGLGLLCAPCARGDTGGGRPATPYKAGEPSEAEVSRTKAAAAQLQTVCIPAGQAPDDPLYSVALVDVTAKEAAHYDPTGRDQSWLAKKKLRYELRGKTSGGAVRTIRFSEIEKITVEKTAARHAVLKVVTWPSITPAELVQRHPDYASLKAGHRAETSLIVDVKAASGKLLSLYACSSRLFGERKTCGDFARTTVIPLSALPEGSEIRFYCDEPKRIDPRILWWAIPSVAMDPTYPYRTVFKD